jgi:iron complex outermembrane receptor protein
MSGRPIARAMVAALGALVLAAAAPGWPQEQAPDEAPSAERAATKDEPAATATADRAVFRGTLTVEDRPIVDDTRLDPFASLVTTVAEQQIDDLHAQDLSSALRRVPGVVISRYNPVGAFGGADGGAFFIRGHGSGRPGGEVTMLTDGVPRVVGIWTHPLVDVGAIDGVQAIDIYRSAQPVLLGNMAFAAVDMASKRRTETGSGGRFVGSLGTFDTLVGTLEYGSLTETFDSYLTAGYRRSDGHRDNAGGEVGSLTGRLGFRLAEGWQASILYEHAASSVDDPGAVGAPALPIVPTYDIANDFVLATLSHAHGSWSGSLKLYRDAGTFDWLQWSGAEAHPFRSVTASANYGIRWRETAAPWAGAELVLGLDDDVYGGEFAESHPAGDRLATDLSFRNTAPYLMLSQTFTAGAATVTPSAGLRYNASRYFGDDWGGQAGLAVGVGGHRVYANWARGFNLPGVWAAVQYGGWGRGEQWQELEAETIDHLELGWLAPLGRTLRLTASLYRDVVDNALRFVPPPPPPPLFANIGSYSVDGFELSLQAEPSERVSLFIGGTLSDAEPATVPNLPRTTAVGGLTWTAAGGWRLNLDLQWVDERFILNPRYAAGEVAVDGYLLANARLGVPWRLLGLDLDGSVFVVGENLGDEDYQHRPGYPMPGRMVQVGVEVEF